MTDRQPGSERVRTVGATPTARTRALVGDRQSHPGVAEHAARRQEAAQADPGPGQEDG